MAFKPGTNKPIKTQKEYDQTLSWLVKMTVEFIGCDKVQAEKRIQRLKDSHKLDGLKPESELFQRIVDEYMTTPVE